MRKSKSSTKSKKSVSLTPKRKPAAEPPVAKPKEVLSSAKLPARLLEVDRKCDGCGVRIGRWTTQCFHDERRNRIYCSTGGCAEKVTSAGKCSSCKTDLNPFAGVITHPGNSRLVFCEDCGLPSKDTPVEKVVDKDIPKKILAGVNLGPYVVTEENEMWKVRLGPGGFLRTSVMDKETAYRKCAEFNENFGAAHVDIE